MQLGNPLRLLLLQAGAEQVREQVVIAPTAAHLVQRHEEQVGPLDRLQHPLPSARPVTASHNAPDSRSSTEVSNRNPRTDSGCRFSTSSVR